MTQQTEDAGLEGLKDRILAAALPNVMFDGWSTKALEDAAMMSGDGPSGLVQAFPEGVGDAVAHLADWADRQALGAFAPETLADMRVRDRITALVRARLEALGPHKEAVRLGVGALLLGRGPGSAGKLVVRTCDRFWRAAGDTATDFNFYSKRGLLAAVLISTTLYWLNDRSDAHEATWGFLDRRIENVLTVGGRLGRIARMGDGLDRLAGPLRLLRRGAGLFSRQRKSRAD